MIILLNSVCLLPKGDKIRGEVFQLRLIGKGSVFLIEFN